MDQQDNEAGRPAAASQDIPPQYPPLRRFDHGHARTRRSGWVLVVSALALGTALFAWQANAADDTCASRAGSAAATDNSDPLIAAHLASRQGGADVMGLGTLNLARRDSKLLATLADLGEPLSPAQRPLWRGNAEGRP
ncbi:MAG: hypothetical protein REI94_19750 [Moraxellaceae bacterium]|nr:hypothetical protein [Moraxellaceae bacterium]